MKFRSFRYLLGEGLKNIWSHRLMSVASAGVLMACMIMIGIVIALTINISGYIEGLEDQNVVMVFFDEELSRDKAIEVSKSIESINNVKKAEFISKEQGLQNQKATMDETTQKLFDWVEDENPLPDSCRVTVDDLDNFDQTLMQIKANNGVDVVRESRDLVNKLTSVRSMIGIVGFWVILLLLIISLVIVSNTIKITMFTRKLEINIMKAVGATNRFIRFPFIIEGVSLGVIAGLFSTAMLYFLYEVAEKYFAVGFDVSSLVPFANFAFYLLGGFVVIGGIVGAIGSIFSIGKYLRHEGSEFNALM